MDIQVSQKDGEFERQEDEFHDWIAADGSTSYPAEPGRYHLYVSLACPWAHRTVIVRQLKGLEDVVGMTVLEPVRDEDLLDIESSRAFAVTGTLRHVAEATSCDGDESRCRIISLGDADLVGIAVRRGDTLTIELDWRTFGAESLAARPEAVVALRWSEIGYLGVAESLEASGAIGTPMVLSLSSHGGRQLAWARGGVAARGALDVWVG